jgi:hypothetical protein
MLGRDPACFGAISLLSALFLAGVAPLHAQSTSAPVEAQVHERSLMAESFASARLAVWQKRLNLQGWDISVVVARASDLRPKTAGNVHWYPEKKSAVIRVLDPADYKLPFAAVLEDIEFTVVHELVHLEMAPVLSDLHRTEANRMEEEHAVNQMTEALLKLDRGK